MVSGQSSDLMIGITLKTISPKIAPASQCLTNDVACDWNETTKAWDIDTASNQAHIDSQAAIQAFVDSAFNDLTLTEANTYIDANWSTLVSSKATFKLLVEFVIGLREVLRGVVTTK